ncbi:MAG: type 1 glutamine amidotransferase [Streptosporangiales bacterium]
MTGSWRALFIQHQEDCPPGYVGDRCADRGADVTVVRARGDVLPDPRGFDLIVPLGSDDSAYDDAVPYLAGERRLLSAAVAADVPVFGICFGAQLLSRVLGGQVRRAARGPEIGWITVETSDSRLVEPGPWLVWHLDVMSAPPGSAQIARTPVATQAFTYGRHLGVQFHPEATPDSAEIWARHYRDSLAEVGLGYEALTAETRARTTEAARRAHALTDRVLERAGILTVA